ncbi:cupin domain-containing protein [Candidatus Binatia bacterium]|nr:cupin domain-containing protein [Candidatus Binatia bacterium]
MDLLHTDSVIRVADGKQPTYDHDNSLLALLTLIEGRHLGAERECYVGTSLQYLFPIRSLALFGPSGSDADVLDPALQDNKVDFQKQNVASFLVGDTFIVRGMVTVGNWSGPFVRISYGGGSETGLAIATGRKLGKQIKLYVKIGGVSSPSLLTVPYVEALDRYEVEIWGYSGPADLASQLGPKGRGALVRGEIQVRPDLVLGSGDDFARERIEGSPLVKVAPTHALHPILPLSIEVAWANDAGDTWDSNGGANYHYRFNMVLRGWNHFLTVGSSRNPHGGVGILEYRNLVSNYFPIGLPGDLGREIEPWSFDAFGNKAAALRRESFLAVDYMDLHVVKANCGIGLHRHRDNQEVFLLMEGRALMVVGDWCKMPDRERCFEVRTLEPGHFAMLKGGNLHALMNPTDEDLSLFMFGGYD